MNQSPNMGKSKITSEIKEKVNAQLTDFNKKISKDFPGIEYIAVYKGNYLYLNRIENKKESEMARLKYTGNFNKWEFAIFRYTINNYDPDACFFPGEDYVNGTIEGALKAVHNAYPPDYIPSDESIINFFSKFVKR